MIPHTHQYRHHNNPAHNGERRLIYVDMPGDAPEIDTPWTDLWNIRSMFDIVNEGEDEVKGRIKYTEFMKGLPHLDAYLRREETDLTPGEVDDLTNLEDWLDTFENNDWLNVQSQLTDWWQDADTALDDMGEPEVAAVYNDFVNKYVPRAIQEKHKDIFEPEKGAMERWKSRKKLMVLNYIRMLTGLPTDNTFDNTKHDEPTVNESIIEETFEHLYYPEGADARDPNSCPSRKLIEDYKKNLIWHRIEGRHPLPTDPQSLQDEALPGHFRGLLRYKMATNKAMLTEKELKTMGAELDKLEDSYRRATVSGSAKLETLTRDLEGDLDKQALSIRDMWSDLSGIEKLILIGGAAFALTRKGTGGTVARYAAAGLGILWFGSKAMKGDPEKQLSDIVNWVHKKTGVNDGHIKMGNKLWEKLPYASQQSLEKEGIAMVLLSKMPMQIIVNSLHPGDCANGRVQLNLESKIFQDALRQNLPEGARFSEIMDYLRANQESVQDSMSFLFYQVARKDPNESGRIHHIDQALGRLPIGCNVFDLKGDDRKMLNSVVLRGIEMVRGDYEGTYDDTVYDVADEFMAAQYEARITAPMQKGPRETPEFKKMEELRGKGLAVNQVGKDFFIGVRIDDSSSVKMGNKAKMKINEADFTSKNADTLLEEWKKSALKQLNDRINGEKLIARFKDNKLDSTQLEIGTTNEAKPFEPVNNKNKLPFHVTSPGGKAFDVFEMETDDIKKAFIQAGGIL